MIGLRQFGRPELRSPDPAVASGRDIRRDYRERAMLRMRFLLFVAASLLAGLVGPAFAQADYPNRPVRLIIPFPPGGSNDVVGRVIAQHLGESLGKQIIVDN